MLKWQYKMLFRKTCIIVVVILAIIFNLQIQAKAQTADEIEKAKEFYKNKTLNIVVPYVPGGGFDAYPRGMGPFLKKYLPETTTIITNLPGGGGVMGVIEVYYAQPDGLTILMIDGPGMAFGQFLKKDTKYDLLKFSWIGRVAYEATCTAVSYKTPYRTAQDFLRDKPELKYAQTGKSNSNYHSNYIMLKALGVPHQDIYGHTGSGERFLALERGDSQGVNLTVSTLLPQIKAGKVYPMFVLANERDERIPEVPTILELAPDKEKKMLSSAIALFELGRGFCAPPNTPIARLKVIEDAFQKVYQDKEFVEWTKKADRPVNPLESKKMKKYIEEAMKGLRGELGEILTDAMK